MQPSASPPRRGIEAEGYRPAGPAGRGVDFGVFVGTCVIPEPEPRPLAPPSSGVRSTKSVLSIAEDGGASGGRSGPKRPEVHFKTPKSTPPRGMCGEPFPNRLGRFPRGMGVHRIGSNTTELTLINAKIREFWPQPGISFFLLLIFNNNAVAPSTAEDDLPFKPRKKSEDTVGKIEQGSFRSFKRRSNQSKPCLRKPRPRSRPVAETA